MNRDQAYQILKEIVESLALRGERISSLAAAPDPALPLESAGIDLIAFSEIVEELRLRFNGKDFHLGQFMVPEEFHYLTLGKLLESLTQSARPGTPNPEVVYVDDEEENLFVFKRKFGKELNLKTFSDPVQALHHIRTQPDVSLVITDEVMPLLSGNKLCDEVRKTKPFMKFVLITGNPNQDDDLMYRSLRQNRFYEFINKPMDLEGKGAEYLTLFRSLMSPE